jgi:dihydroxyacetone kinase-like protein
MNVTRDEVWAWIEACARVLAENRAYLVQLDAAIGDADHGANMDRGFQAIMKKAPELGNMDIGALLKTCGMTLLSTVGGAGGPLYGTFFIQAGTSIGSKLELTAEDWNNALSAAVDGVIRRGKAAPGDKTMVDALSPALIAFQQAVSARQSFGNALQLSAEAARQGMEATTPMVARKGRASYLGARSAGHQDPGATSSYLILKAAAETWADE